MSQVVEHLSDQDLHMLEVNRTLKKEGVCYMATPNQDLPIMEGHKGTPRVSKYGDMIRFFKKHNFEYLEYSVNIFKQLLKYYPEIKCLNIIPQFLFK